MVDSSGIISNSGFFHGEFANFGDYDQCLSIKAPIMIDNKPIRGQFCIVNYIMPLPPKPKNLNLQTKVFDFKKWPVKYKMYNRICNIDQLNIIKES